MKVLQKLKLKIPPPLLFLLCVSLMWWIARTIPLVRLPDYRHKFVLGTSAVVAILGLYIAFAAVYSMRKARTSFNAVMPDKANQIINRGIYARSRNPMYLSLCFGLVTWALLLGAFLAWTVVPLFIWLITVLQIEPEEQILAEKFGAEYQQYLVTVNRWL